MKIERLDTLLDGMNFQKLQLKNNAYSISKFIAIFLISSLSSYVIFTLIFPRPSLSDICTLGILLVALAALKYTKEQTQTWRLINAIEHFQKSEKMCRKISSKATQLIYMSNVSEQKTAYNTLLNDFLNNINQEERKTLDETIYELQCASSYLEFIKGDNINEIIDILSSIKTIITLHDIGPNYTDDPEELFEGIREELITIHDNKGKALIKYGIGNKVLMIDKLISNVKKDVIKKK